MSLGLKSASQLNCMLFLILLGHHIMYCPGFNAPVVQDLNMKKKKSSVDVPAAMIQKDGLQT